MPATRIPSTDAPKPLRRLRLRNVAPNPEAHARSDKRRHLVPRAKYRLHFLAGLHSSRTEGALQPKGCEKTMFGFQPETDRGASTFSQSKFNPKGEMPTIQAAVGSPGFKSHPREKFLCLKALPHIQPRRPRSGTRCATQPTHHAKPTARVGEGIIPESNVSF